MRIAIAFPSNSRIDNDTDFYGRLNFTNLDSTLTDGSIRIEDLRLRDEGNFTCGFDTLDNETQATITLAVNGTSQVEADRFVTRSRGQEVTLRCVYVGSQTPLNITWQKVNRDSSVEIAIAFLSGYNIFNDTDLYGRLNFTNLDSALTDGSIRIEDLRLRDEGNFTCSFSTFDDEAQATISLTVNDDYGDCAHVSNHEPQINILHSYDENNEASRYFPLPFRVPVPPKILLELNPFQLVEGMGLVTVATYVALGGKPAASITWSGLDRGSSNETTELESDGTVTVRSRYWLEPTQESHGRTLTCRVEHPALEHPVEHSNTLDVHYKPSVSIAGYHGDWYVGKEGASLSCEADANPSITRYLWGRQDGSLPNGIVVSGNSLSFERPLVESDSGSFSCWANNSVGWDEAVVIITIQPGTTTAAITTTTATTPVATPTTPGGGGVEPWVIAVATVVPLMALVAAVGAIYYFCFHKNRKPLKRKDDGENDQQRAPVEMPASGLKQQHKEHSYEYIDSKLPHGSVVLERPPFGSVTAMPEYDAVPEELTSWNPTQHLDERIMNSIETSPPKQEASSHYESPRNEEDSSYYDRPRNDEASSYYDMPRNDGASSLYELLQLPVESAYDKLSHPTFTNA
ncbi:uncharacterized protein LOC142906273 [Petromyzon marinus]|uniref:uncharacterized protein LOC142906273 n=1 Tax=Petromyzon marinus TaxID=7757 RepID=UPI003F701875